MPAYASACSGAVRYSSACSCLLKTISSTTTITKTETRTSSTEVLGPTIATKSTTIVLTDTATSTQIVALTMTTQLAAIETWISLKLQVSGGSHPGEYLSNIASGNEQFTIAFDPDPTHAWIFFYNPTTQKLKAGFSTSMISFWVAASLTGDSTPLYVEGAQYLEAGHTTPLVTFASGTNQISITFPGTAYTDLKAAAGSTSPLMIAKTGSNIAIKAVAA
ncbi:hypothetical protein ABW20_dc0104483 [Dactylellina cionopaga]|nr:hypothetical protein ABW20_dc0104483 [Dactylellina cionopaga]